MKLDFLRTTILWIGGIIPFIAALAFVGFCGLIGANLLGFIGLVGGIAGGLTVGVVVQIGVYWPFGKLEEALAKKQEAQKLREADLPQA